VAGPDPARPGAPPRSGRCGAFAVVGVPATPSAPAISGSNSQPAGRSATTSAAQASAAASARAEARRAACQQELGLRERAERCRYSRRHRDHDEGRRQRGAPVVARDVDHGALRTATSTVRRRGAPGSRIDGKLEHDAADARASRYVETACGRQLAACRVEVVQLAPVTTARRPAATARR